MFLIFVTLFSVCHVHTGTNTRSMHRYQTRVPLSKAIEYRLYFGYIALGEMVM